MLQIKDLSINLREDSRIILKNFSFNLNKDDKVALIGEEGNGKSILLKTIIDRKEVEKYCDISGEIYKKNEVIGYLPQDLGKEYLDLSVQDYIYINLGDVLLDHNLFYNYLCRFNLSRNLLSNNIKIRFLSGGEKIKFLLLVELLKEPTIFIFDEPSNDLDYESILWLEDFMKNLNLPMIFVSHDIKLLSGLANKIIHLEQVFRRTKAKFTISNNTYDEYVSKRQKSITIESNRSKKELEEFSKKVDKYRRLHDSVQFALRATKANQPTVGKNLKDKMHTVKSIGKRLEKEEKNLTNKPDFENAIDIFFDKDIVVPKGKVILDFKLDVLKVGKKILSKNIELKIIGPQRVCIVGRNGAGKTTLMKLLMNTLIEQNLKVGYMPQSYFEFEKDNISAIHYLEKEGTKNEHTRISTLLASLNFKREEMFRKITDLSGGQKAKLFFAKMNLDKAEVLILDEPTRNLSPLSQPEITDALINYKGAIIAVSHNRDFIDKVFDKVYELNISGLRLLK